MRLTTFACAAIAAGVQLALCGGAAAQSGDDSPIIEHDQRQGAGQADASA